MSVDTQFPSPNIYSAYDIAGTRPIVISNDDPGAVGQYVFWWSPTFGTLKSRNATNTGWVDAGGPPGSADVPTAFGGGSVAQEFNSGVSPFTWDSAVDAEDVGVTRPSHLYVRATTLGSNSAIHGKFPWVPGPGAFDIRAKMSLGSRFAGGYSANGLDIRNADDTSRTHIQFAQDVSGTFSRVYAFTFAGGSHSQQGASVLGTGHVGYQRITRDGSNNVSWWWSSDGWAWNLIATTSFTFTIASVGITLVFGIGAITTDTYCDWIRSNV